MSSTSQAAKLAYLRAKTDRQLVGLIDRELELGLSLVADRGRADQHRARAERACSQARRLLPTVYSLSERLRLERKLAELRNMLDCERPQVQTAGG